VPVAPLPSPPIAAASGAIASLVIDPLRPRGGVTAVGTVTLRSPAPAGGTVVGLASSDRDVRPPASITIAAGSTVGMFQIPTSEPHADTDVRISASVADGAATADIVLVLPAPGAHNDSYSVRQGELLVVTAPGVLDNDRRRSGHDLTAVLKLAPLSGTVSLESDGGFTYRPGLNLSGPDRFTYHAMDGDTRSNEATVNITVLGLADAPPGVAPPAGPTGLQNFAFTGAAQTFVVPAGVTQITIEAFGAQGGSGSGIAPGVGGAGGLGGRIQATIAVVPGSTYQVNVGGQGGTAATHPGGGGGASDIRTGANTLNDRVVVAGAGGGGAGASPGGSPVGGAGGAGGGPIGAVGGTSSTNGIGGDGGTQFAGGLPSGGSNAGQAGTLGQGGNGCCALFGGAGGFNGGGQAGPVFTGGPGGGGYYGGGGGSDPGNGSAGGGGGGGSSFAIVTATAVIHQQGVRSGAGAVLIRW
jgi:hypothetical protein